MRACLVLMLIGCLGIMVGGPSRAAAPYPVTVTDVAGRTVTIDREPQRVILGTGRTVYALDVLFDDDLFDRIIAWRGDLIRNDNALYQIYRRRFPKVASLPTVGSVSHGDFDVERAITMEADLLVLDQLSHAAARQSGLMDTLSAAGTQTIFIDFMNDPPGNTARSMALLGEVFDRKEPAAEFNAFYRRHLDRIQQTTAGLKGRKSVFIERAAGLNGLDQCCRTWGRSNLGLLAEAAGLDNVGSALLPGDSGFITMEKVLIENPDLFVFTGADWSLHRAGARSVPLGYGILAEDSREAFGPLLARPGFAALDATRKDEIYALYHQFFISPFNIIAALFLAKWAYPEAYRDVDPSAEMAYLQERFIASAPTGTFGLRHRPGSAQ